jgi:CRISPR-associated protein Cas2
MKSWHLVAYDVRDAARLRRVAKVLEGYGERLQWSVFRCLLSAREVERLRWELTKVMKERDDLLIVPMCGSCARRVVARGPARGFELEEQAWEII